MKKLLSVILVLVLALSFSSVALGEYNMFTYQHPVLGYTMQAPADWLYLDSQNIATLVTDPSVSKNFPYVDISTYAQQCIDNEMAMFIMPSGVNFNVVSEYVGAPYSAAQLNALLIPNLLSQYKQIFGSVDFLVDGDVFKAGNHEYAYIMYVTGDTIGAQYCLCESGRLYYLTLTTTSALNTLEYIQIEKMFEKVLASFAE
ncbi:MAG: hypothetical protein IIW08_09795 [Clostridia bacterium]|nr:hypothetical protein [Clostridia bacterium]MBQ2434149.1 hypothetical protein [Clostridia bacterium]MBQ5771454.1 hypothetical protein [Clostridia bacterium]